MPTPCLEQAFEAQPSSTVKNMIVTVCKVMPCLAGHESDCRCQGLTFFYASCVDHDLWNKFLELLSEIAGPETFCRYSRRRLAIL